MLKLYSYTNKRQCKIIENLTIKRVTNIIKTYKICCHCQSLFYPPASWNYGEKNKMNIVLNRIDERLIHGQVLISWAKKLSVRQILIVDDQAAEDVLEKTVLSLSVPMGIELKILNCHDALEYINSHLNGCFPNTILLTRSPHAMKYLWDNGYRPESINIGGMAAGASRSLLCRGIYISEEERQMLRQMQLGGVEIYAQVVYAETKVPLSRLL